MVSIQPTKFFFFFSLRQGAICVAVIELAMASFSVLLLVLGAERAQEIANEASADMADAGTEGFGDTDLAKGPILLFNDGPMLHRGQQLATVVTFMLYTGVILAMTHFLSCILLLNGAVRGIPRFLLPWISSILLGLILSGFSLLLFAFLPYRGCKAEIYAASFILFTWEFHSWLIVYSFYRELMSTAACRLATNILTSYDYVHPVHHPKVDI